MTVRDQAGPQPSFANTASYAAFAVALALGELLASAVRFAAACGALATTRPGAAEAAPALDEVNALLAAQQE